jgi:acetyl esterase/lipase
MKQLLLSVLILAVAATIALADATSQPASSITVEHDVVYTTVDQTPLHLDIAIPPGDGPFPTIVFLHGGGWKAGNYRDMRGFIGAVAAMGYVGVTVQYRLVPAAHFPAQIEDCKTAVRWLRANAAKYHVRQDRMGAVGFSAGGHLACLLGVTDKSDGLEGAGNLDQSSKVQAVVSVFGPTDFSTRDWDPNLERDVIAPFLGGSFTDKPDVYKKASPISYVKKDAPPFLFFHGDSDTIVPVDQTRRLAEKLRSVGASAEAVILAGEHHGFSGPNNEKSLKQMMEFLAARLKKE